jgi:hypothetical protein
MFPSLGLTDHQNVLEVYLLFVRRGWERGIDGWLILCGHESRQKQKKE